MRRKRMPTKYTMAKNMKSTEPSAGKAIQKLTRMFAKSRSKGDFRSFMSLQTREIRSTLKATVAVAAPGTLLAPPTPKLAMMSKLKVVSQNESKVMRKSVMFQSLPSPVKYSLTPPITNFMTTSDTKMRQISVSMAIQTGESGYQSTLMPRTAMLMTTVAHTTAFSQVSQDHLWTSWLLTPLADMDTLVASSMASSTVVVSKAFLSLAAGLYHSESMRSRTSGKRMTSTNASNEMLSSGKFSAQKPP
mmetsp:Transcript_21682/g.58022  ORF Transcript_21682/g.58022 Transcript_21682/m.58022 type:complete len:247 (+) Transcript_21682:904-1644(+)